MALNSELYEENTGFFRLESVGTGQRAVWAKDVFEHTRVGGVHHACN